MLLGLYAINFLDSLAHEFKEAGTKVVTGDSGGGIMKVDGVGRIIAALYSAGENTKAELYGGTLFEVSKLAYKNRSVEKKDIFSSSTKILY